MKHWKERILQMKFGRVVRRLAIFSVCAVLLGGILSVVLLQPQISQITSAAQQEEQIDAFRGEWGFQPSVFQPVPCVTPSIARCFRCERYEVEDDQCQEAVGRSYPQTADHVDKEHVSEYASSCLTFPCFGHQSSFCICEITRL